MTRGNQRDLARAKNQKKQQEMQKKKNANDKTGMSLEQRKHRPVCTMVRLHTESTIADSILSRQSIVNRDAELMREKQRKKEEQEGGQKQAVN